MSLEDALQSPPPSVTIAAPQQVVRETRVNIPYKIQSTGGGIGEVRLFHNGKLIQSDGQLPETLQMIPIRSLGAINSRSLDQHIRGVKVIAEDKQSPQLLRIQSPKKADSMEGIAQIEAVSGENTLSVVAFNSDNTVQSYMPTVRFHAEMVEDPPELYVLAIGIDRYRMAEANLRFAVKDAMDFRNEFAVRSETLFPEERTHIFALFDDEATRKKILETLTTIANVIRSKDQFVLFIASHGVTDGNVYYIVTHDFDGNYELKRNVISSNELIEASKHISAFRQLFILDTCNAGGMDRMISGLYNARISVQARMTGIHIYAGASSFEQALDGYDGNGLFTHALLSGLRSAEEVDKNTNSIVTVSELGSYSEELVMKIGEKIGHAQNPIIIGFGQDHALYRLQSRK
jgi:hypothetical protein